MMLHTIMELPDDGQEPFPKMVLKNSSATTGHSFYKVSWKFMNIHKNKISNKVTL
jgi:hypothetical protein